MANFPKEAKTYGDFPSLFVGLVTPDGGLEHYDGLLRIMDSNGKMLENGLAPEKFRDVIGEAVQSWTYLKFPYYKPYGFTEGAGMYRVGPLARLNICDYAGTPRADRELRQFRRLAPSGKPVTSSFYYHYARLIEILFGLERIQELVDDPEITSKYVRADAGVNELKGVGVCEAPRGTLFHEYEVKDYGVGVITKVNMLIATGNNNLAMNKTVRQIAQAYIDGKKLSEGLLNRVEHGIRLYDPCLSCSTHAVGQMPMDVQLIGADGELLDEVVRE
jgi:NAD-reducing hydrogenase large subunit